ncbi:YqiA/YcfP family alpha/beta fold hydrolase [Gayadomonas joobiniege]|uniref:YqiA/YcfP family alpha/beta fold hydrolase n=1 Tax=Gayadomonas joobiniege TaxID=1234606 RepID=UPI0004752C04|nr:YqiA/YcfP family alpha/beta fold hydrolase [Gayadomonas joobiniege]
MTTKKIIYLHGFLSSPQSMKAELTKQWFYTHYPDIKLIIPQLANEPNAIRAQLEALLHKHKNQLIGFIGSSLGGFLAAWCARQNNLPAVLINPAAYPWRLLNEYLGQHTNPYTKQTFFVTEDYNQSLKQFDCLPNLQTLMVLLQTGDQTLDYREAEQKYQGCSMQVIPDGDHAFINYQDYLPKISQFLLSKSS